MNRKKYINGYQKRKTKNKVGATSSYRKLLPAPFLNLIQGISITHKSSSYHCYDLEAGSGYDI
jgi:hypothetical protein